MTSFYQPTVGWLKDLSTEHELSLLSTEHGLDRSFPNASVFPPYSFPFLKRLVLWRLSWSLEGGKKDREKMKKKLCHQLLPLVPLLSY
jgi:hypothetical protein